jgi:hypothetical protein
MTEQTARQEAGRHVRAWAGEQLRRLSSNSTGSYGRELGTVRCEWESTGFGFPQTVGEFNEPVEPTIVPEHYELIFLLPAEAQQLANELADKLRVAMAEDETLGDRVHMAEVPPGVVGPEDGGNEDFEGSLRVRVPVTVYLGP